MKFVLNGTWNNYLTERVSYTGFNNLRIQDFYFLQPLFKISANELLHTKLNI